MTHTHDTPEATLAIFTATYAKNGQLKKVREYVDVETGEILPATEFPTLTLGPKLEQRSAVLSKLRPEVRAFASFVLKFSNKRRGITPGIDTLCQWYADLHGKRGCDVRRYIKPLLETKVLMHGSLLGPLFQRTGGRTRDHLGEHENASAIYLRMRHADFDPINGKTKRVADPAQVAAEVTILDAEMYAEQATWAAMLKAQTVQTSPVVA
jgi:hypothetical protein